MKNLQKKGAYLKEKSMGKNKFGEFLRKLLGWIREQTITTYDKSGKIIEVTNVTTRLSVSTIIYKLFLELMIVLISISLLLNIYSFFIVQHYLSPERAYIRSVFFNPIDFFSIMLLWWFIWLHSKIYDDDVVYMASLKDRQ